MGYCDENFEYSEDKNKEAKKYKFLNINYEGEVIDEGKILSMHQLEGMVFPENVSEIEYPFVKNEKGYEFIRVIYSDELERKEGLVKAKQELAEIKKG